MLCHFKATLITYGEGKKKARAVWDGGIPVKLPARDERLFMVVVRGFGQEPTMLLTNCRVNLRVKENIWRIVEIHLTRCKCDESIRYIRQS